MSEEYLQFFNISDDHYVNVSMKLWRVKDNVKIKANYSGTPAKGYQVDKITTTPETISIAGSEEAIKKTGGQWKYPGDSWRTDQCGWYQFRSGSKCKTQRIAHRGRGTEEFRKK